MYIPFLARQKTNAWQLAVLPCVFGMLFYCASRMGVSALLGGSVALLGFLLTGGLRACAIGLCLYMAGAAGCLLHSYSTIDFHGPMTVLIAAMGAYMLVCLVRLALPVKMLTPDAQVNFRSFFRIAGLGLLVFLSLVLFYGFFLIRIGDDQRGLNLIPLRALCTWDIIFLGNIFLFFPLGFLLRGLFRRGTWISVALCAGFSLLMEVLQWVFAIGRSDIDDLLLNTLGGTLGVAVVLLLGALRKKITDGTESSDFLAWA